MNISAIGEHSKTTDSPLNRVAVDLQFYRHIFLSSIGALLALGLVMVYSASITARPTEPPRFSTGTRKRDSSR